jgi:hypothetical protein
MKKSLMILTVMAVSLAFVGVAFAGAPIGCPAPCVTKLVPAGFEKLPGMKPGPVAKAGVPTPPKCITQKVGCMTNVITCPGSSYAIDQRPVQVKYWVKADVMKDLCLGKSKGQCMPCGFCVPVKWECKWKTSVICGETKLPKYKTEMEDVIIPVVCKTEPCPPPPCF